MAVSWAAPIATATASGSSEHPADEPTLVETYDWQLLRLCDAMFLALSREVHGELQEVEKIMLVEEIEEKIKEINA